MTSKFKKVILGASGLLGGTSLGFLASCSSDGNPIPVRTETEPTNTNEDAKYEERVEASRYGANPSASSKRFDANVQDKIIIGTTWSEGGPQVKALNAIIEKYNELVEAGSSDVASVAKMVEQKNIGSGYTAGASQVDRDLTARNGKELYNLILNYPNVASRLAEYDMLLSFNDELAKYNTDINRFVGEFKKSNENIEFVQNDSTYIIPFAKSTLAFSINAPVLSYIIDEMKKAGAKIADDQDTQNFVKTLDAKGKNDRNSVASIWGNARSGVNFNDYTISMELFKNYKDLLEFSEKAQSLFEKSYNNNDPVNAQTHVFGMSDPTSFMKTSLFSQVDGDYEKMDSYSTKVNGITKTNFGALKSGGTASTELSKIYTTLSKAVSSGGVKLYPSGQYPSGEQTKHLIAFSTGSTSGFERNFISSDPIFIKNEIRLSSDLSSDSDTMVSFNLTKLGNDEVAKFSKFDNKLYKYTYKIADKDAEKKERFNLVFASEADQKAFEDKVNSSPDTHKDFIIKVSNYKDGKDSENYKKLYEDAKSKGYFAGFVKEVKKDPSKAKTTLLLYMTGGRNSLDIQESAKKALEGLGFELTGKDTTRELNREELVAISAPLKWSKENRLNVIYGQGPSLIGIHTNTGDDWATKAFVSWLFNNKVYDFKSPYASDDKTYRLTAIQFFDKFASYYTASTESKNLDSTIFGDNDFLKNASELFKTAQNENGYVIYEEPASSFSDPFRRSIDGAFSGLQQSAINKNPQSFDQFVEKLKFPNPTN
ncbi:Uncharacterized lipoprotein MPN_097 precursor [Mycoplasmopsis citelli]|uniref:Uncharacterized lipoprotein MPN_097 n=1 Tax=Mycoplasmopsis citelli TaxID=171281 RepID=A0A449B1N8_9BACT|nr:P80 family lipoprotein [Mycoplasmopsis citelli]VEU74481.1 Uncharacterized lipoprotein MPN_097 precursor [Mycoplasmopsis citelli]